MAFHLRFIAAAIGFAALAGACERAPVPEASPAGDRVAGRGRAPASKCRQLKPRPPRVVAAATPGLPRSSISVTVPLALSSLQPEIDRLLPTSLSDPAWPRTHRITDEVCATWYFTRAPISLGAASHGLTLAIPGKFGVIADPHVGFAGVGCTQPYVSCGDVSAGAPPISITVNLDATLAFDKDYRFSGKVTNRGTSFAQPCQIASGIIDATSLIQQIVDTQINNQLTHINDAIRNRADFRAQVEAPWKAVQQPRKLAGDLWLVVHPEAVSGRLDVVDPSTIAAQLAVEGSIEIVQALAAPPVTLTALPDLTASVQPAGGARVAMAGSLAYSTITSRLQSELSGQHLQIEFPAHTVHNLTVRDVKASGPVRCTAGPCLEVAIDLDGDVCGTVYLVGRPELDASHGEVVLRDVEFSIDSSSAMVNVAAWLRRGELIQRITDTARFSISAALDRVQKVAGTALPVSISHTLELTGSIGQPAVTLGAGATGIDYQVSLTGTLAVTQKAAAARNAP